MPVEPQPARKGIRSRRTRVIRLYAAGLSPHEISDKLRVRLDHVNRHIRAALDDVLDEFADTSPRDLFARHVLQQRELARRLRETEDSLVAAGGTKYAHSLIASVRTRTEITADLLEKATAHGVMPSKMKPPAVKRTQQEIKDELRSEIAILTGLLDAAENPPKPYKKKTKSRQQEAGTNGVHGTTCRQ